MLLRATIMTFGVEVQTIVILGLLNIVEENLNGIIKE